MDKWLCPACVGKETDADLNNDEDDRPSREENQMIQLDKDHVRTAPRVKNYYE